ncbi:hypothetical protein G6F43_011995 [Rhizopus delemar]|nr:hypothetical protein G6F43_011995 [Rhizopus delemar]
MGRLIRYSLSCKSRYDIYPIVVIFAINGFSSVEVEKDFESVDGSPFFTIQSKFWTKSCLLISQSSIKAHVSSTPMLPIVALGYFLTSGSLSLSALKYKEDRTVQQLYEISHKLAMEELKHQNKSVEPLESLLEQVKRKIEDVVDDDSSSDQETAKKLKDCVNESLEMISEQTKLLSTASSQESINDNKYTEEDMLFIESNSTVGRNKNWKMIFDKGKAQGYFKSYSSAHSLKTSYYHSQERKQL